jgi:hypothetical protein
MTHGLGLKYEIYRWLPKEPPGILRDDLLDALELAGNGTTKGTLQQKMHLLYNENSLRSDGRNPARYWRGPQEPKPSFISPARPFWTRPDKDLLRECREGRREIVEAMRR